MAEALATTVCDDCHGRGWVVRPDGGNGSAAPCACRGSVTVEERMAKAGVPAAYRECSFASFDPSVNGPVPERVLAYAANPSGSLLILGRPGRGKSHVAAAVLRQHLEAGRYGLWCDTPEFVNSLKATGDWEAAHRRVERLATIGMPVLDDLGAEMETEWTRETLARVIRQRHADGTPLVATTNKTMAELQMWDPAVASRLAFGLVVEMEGRDYRPLASRGGAR